MANWRNVRVTDTHGIFREDTQNPDTGEHFPTHVTGFDADGNPVRPIHTIPDTSTVRSALNETRLEEVRDSDVETLRAQHDDERRRVVASRPSTSATTISLTPDELQARLTAAVIDAQAKGKGADPVAIAAAHTQQEQVAQGQAPAASVTSAASDLAPPA